MGSLIGIAAAVAILMWLLGRKPVEPAPGDDITTPIDREELEQAERELAEDTDARPIHDAFEDDEDDWGPGTSHSHLPF